LLKQKKSTMTVVEMQQMYPFPLKECGSISHDEKRMSL